MGFLDKLFGKKPAPPAGAPDKGLFKDLTQQQLNSLASMMPMMMDVVRSPGKATVVVSGMSEPDAHLVRGLTDVQYGELREIQEIFRSATKAEDSQKLSLYLRCVERAPWHCHALKSVGVRYYMQGDKKHAFEYLKRAIDLAPDDEEIRANFQHVRQEV
jgi:tetratricopeptide (TPR) repeat protein